MKMHEGAKEILKDTAAGAIVLAVVCGLGYLVLRFHETCVPILGGVVLVVLGVALSLVVGGLTRSLWHAVVTKDWSSVGII